MKLLFFLFLPILWVLFSLRKSEKGSPRKHYRYHPTPLALFLSLVVGTTSIYPASYSCDGEWIGNGVNGDLSRSYSENSWGRNRARYFRFEANVDGVVQLSVDKKNTRQQVRVGSSCNDNNIYDGANNRTNVDVSFNVNAGTTYYIRIKERNNANHLYFDVTFNFYRNNVLISKTVDDSSPEVGDTVHFTVTTTNRGQDKRIEFRDGFPTDSSGESYWGTTANAFTNVTFTNVPSGVSCSWQSYNGPYILCTTDSVYSHDQSFTVTINATVAKSGHICNRAHGYKYDWEWRSASDACMDATAPSNTKPVADPQSVTTDEDTAVAITLTGHDDDGDPLTYSIVSNPSHGTLSGTAPNLTYTPDSGYSGSDSFTFKVNDGKEDSDPATVSITINPSSCHGCDCSLDDNNINNSSPGQAIPDLHGATTDVTKCISGVTDNAESSTDKRDYYYFVVQTDGNLTIEATSPNSHPYHLQIGTTPGGDDIKPYNPTSASWSSGSISLHAGDGIYIYIKETGSDLDEYQLLFNFTTGTIPIVENADDLCYDDITYSVDGFGMCMDFGIFKGGMNCRQTIMIRNWRAYDLTDVETDIDISGFSGNIFADCGIDENSGNCQEKSGLNFGPAGILNRAISYDMPDYGHGGVNDSHSIYETSLINAAIFSGENLYATYIRDGKRYRGKIKPCSKGYCETHNLSEGFHVVDPDGGDESNSFEIYCDRSSGYAPRDLIALPIKNQFNNFLFDNDTLASTDYYAEATNHSKGWQAIEINANTTDNNRLPVLSRSDWEPLTTGNYTTMGGAFSNINLTATPFRIDWSTTSVSECDDTKLRKAYYGQDVKINTLDYTKARCKIDTMNLTLLDDYKYLVYKSNYLGHNAGEEVLERTCKELSEAIPIDVLPSEDIRGHYWITPHRDRNSSTGYDRTHASTDILKADERPFVAYCWYQTDLNWAWTFLLAMDGKRTISKTDLENGQDTCSQLGLFPFVANSEESFERVRKFLYREKAQWSNYTGTIEEKVNALYGNHYYLSTEKSQPIWPYGSFGVYYDQDNNRTWGGEDVGSNTHHPGPMSGSPMHNIPSITQDYPAFDNDENNTYRNYYSWGHLNNDGLYSATDSRKDNNYEYKDTMGAKGWKSILSIIYAKMGVNYPDSWFISRSGAGENFDNSSGSYPYYEPNGNYQSGCWLNYLYDSTGRVRHNDDWDCNYPYYDYMCMADTNYLRTNRGYAPAGLFNIVRDDAMTQLQANGTDPLAEDNDPLNSLYMQLMSTSFTIRAVALASDKVTLHNYNGLVGLELTPTPNYQDSDTDEERQQKCENAPTLKPGQNENIVRLTFEANNTFSNAVSDSYSRAHRSLTYRIKYLKNPNYDEAIEWDSSDACENGFDNLECIWQTLENRIYSINGCDPDTDDCPCESVCDPDSGNADKKEECLKCIFVTSDLSGAACARDSFSVRPWRFDLNTSSPDAPNLLRSGLSYSFHMVAVDGSGSNALDYNITDSNELKIDTSRFHKLRHDDKTVDDENLSGDVNSSMKDDVYFFNGVSSLDGTPDAAGSAEEVLDMTFDDVGTIVSYVRESNWTEVDQNGPEGCIKNSGSNTLVDGMYGCDIEGNITVTFIPHHFKVENIHLRNHRDGDFTYLSNDLNMSAHLDANISARNADDEITRNFREGDGFYENPVEVNLSVPHPTVDGVTLISIEQNISSAKLGFGGSDEANGTRAIAWNDSNASQQLKFNYRRAYNRPINPFDVNGSAVTVTVRSRYDSELNSSATAEITGSGNGDRNATFYYARVRPSMYLYDDIDTNNTKTPISIVVYSDDPTLIDGTVMKMTNDYKWYLNTLHNDPTDGQVTLIPVDSSKGTVSSPSLGNGEDTDVTVTAVSSTRPLIVDIDLTGTDSWLIYNKDRDAVPSPFYRVRFIGEGNWTGEGETGHVVGGSVNKKKLRRLEW